MSGQQAKPEGTDEAQAQYERGNALFGQRRLDEAIAAYRAAIALRPEHAQAHNNLGVALQARGLTHEAIAAHNEAVRLMPEYASAWSNLGTAHQRRGDVPVAIAAFQTAVRLNPTSATALYNLACLLRIVRRPGEAIEAFRRAIEFKPAFPEALSNLAAVLTEEERLDEALGAYDRALELRPEWRGPAAQAVHLRRTMCLWDGLTERANVLCQAIASEAPPAVEIPPFSMLPSAASAGDLQRCARQWAVHKRFVPAATPFAHPPRPLSGRRRRIGYLSADFHEHATAYLIAGLLEAHDRHAFEVVAYSYGRPDSSEMRQRLQSACDRFVDVASLSDHDAAGAIHSDEVDILVDLKGYTQYARTGILTARPAPIQVQFLGYPGTMGTPTVDYLVADPFVVPESEFGAYDEQIVQMPDCYQPNDPRRSIGPVPTRGDAGLPDRGLILGSFNETYKIAPAMFDIWMRLLREAPDSVLWLIASNRWAPENLRREARARGVDPMRLIFAPRVAQTPHLGRLGLADLMLDTFPVNAHTTASDALWAGVPLLTCAGTTFASRVAGSLLRTMGLDQLVADSLEDYEARAHHLVANPTRLQELRALVAARRSTSPLFDASRFARRLECAYRIMWNRYARGEAPTAILARDIERDAESR